MRKDMAQKVFLRWVLDNLGEEHKFNFNVISAAPQEIVQSALEGIVPPDHIFGTRFRYNEATGEVDSIIRAAAGWGKISVLEELRANLSISHDHIIYLGDGSSDLPVMMHVHQHDGLTIAVSEAKFISRVAKRTVLSARTMSVLVPVLERVMNWKSAEIRRFFGSTVLRCSNGTGCTRTYSQFRTPECKLQRYLMTTPRRLS
jgi:predicted HAD superfamily phosphohydrolase